MCEGSPEWEDLNLPVCIYRAATAAATAAKSLQSCPTLCDPMNCSPPGSSVHWILQARILEWVAISICKPPLNNFWSTVGYQIFSLKLIKEPVTEFTGFICLLLDIFLVLFFFFFFGCSVRLVGFSFPNQGLNRGPWQGKCQVLTTGPPGNSATFIIIYEIDMWLSLRNVSCLSHLFCKLFECPLCPTLFTVLRIHQQTKTKISAFVELLTFWKEMGNNAQVNYTLYVL